MINPDIVLIALITIMFLDGYLKNSESRILIFIRHVIRKMEQRKKDKKTYRIFKEVITQEENDR